MFRKVRLNSLEAVAAYAYCEDLLRPTTHDEEAYRLAQHLPNTLKEKVLKLMKNRSEASVLRDLESIVRSHDFEDSNVPMKMVHYLWEFGGMSKEDLESTEPGTWPVVHLLTIDTEHYILYTTQMNYVDGYDPFTGEDNIPIIPDNLIGSIRMSLRHRVIPKPRASEPIQSSRKSPRISKKTQPQLFSENVKDEEVKSPSPPTEVFVIEPKRHSQSKEKPQIQEIVVELPPQRPVPMKIDETPPRKSTPKPIVNQPPKRPSPKRSADPPIKKLEHSHRTSGPRKTDEPRRNVSEDEETAGEGVLGNWKQMADNLDERGRTRERCADCALI